jgi:glycerol-3-phosphate dehydrogenase subunit B
MKFGVATDDSFRAMKDGKTIENIYVAGSVLSGFNAIKDGCGAGVSLITALNVADQINAK